MDSSSGMSSNSSGQQNSGSEGDLRQVMDQRKRKRMISNRESARRSRLRKQNHLDGLMAQVAELRKENQQILTGLNATTHNYMSVESDNAILRAQMAELSHRLQSLDEIVSFMAHPEPAAYGMADLAAGFGNGYWNCLSQPIMMAASASADHGFLF
ncbi:ocs element-binding factor 1 [Phtheirospermum japonicum]|uniref:Ocs element-binding factor 1 n=1 Tax=Phtheirospermum japonicum TaxID=374723 RepID=A0A830BLJ9_9LAMI|nr:ocs element-binding factor 1 [Phtheirospermum japonicum]